MSSRPDQSTLKKCCEYDAIKVEWRFRLGDIGTWRKRRVYFVLLVVQDEKRSKRNVGESTRRLYSDG